MLIKIESYLEACAVWYIQPIDTVHWHQQPYATAQCAPLSSLLPVRTALVSRFLLSLTLQDLCFNSLDGKQCTLVSLALLHPDVY